MQTTFLTATKRVGYYGGNVVIIFREANWSDPNSIYSIGSDGVQRWAKGSYVPLPIGWAGDDSNYRCLAIDSNDNLYIGGKAVKPTRPEMFFKTDVNHNILWTKDYFDFGYDTITTIRDVTVDHNDNSIVGCVQRDDPFVNDCLYKFDPDGDLLWSVDAGWGGDDIDIAVDMNNDIYIATDRRAVAGGLFASVFKYSGVDGHLIWSRDTLDDAQVVAINNRGVVYVGTDHQAKKVWLFNTDGTEIQTPSNAFSELPTDWGDVMYMVIDIKCNVYLSCHGHIYKYNRVNAFQWEFDPGGSTQMWHMALDHQKYLYATAGGAFDLNKISTVTGERVWFKSYRGDWPYGVVVAHGYVPEHDETSQYHVNHGCCFLDDVDEYYHLHGDYMAGDMVWWEPGDPVLVPWRGVYRCKYDDTDDSIMPHVELFWDRISSDLPCGNANWNEVEEFENARPDIYTATFAQIKTTPDGLLHELNTTLHLRKEHGEQTWTYDRRSVRRAAYCSLSFHFSADPEYTIFYMFGSDRGRPNKYCFSYLDEDPSNIVMSGVGNDLGEGIASVYPGQYWPWDPLTTYAVDSIVTWGGYFHKATIQTTGSRPPGYGWTQL